MTRSKFGPFILFIFLWLMSLTLKAQAFSSKDSTPPNIVYILADDLGYGDVSAYNENSKLHTRHIDRLAREGKLFTDAHTGSAVCTPTRYGILTGRYSWRSSLKKGVLSGYSKALIGQNRLTVAKVLQKRDYHTAFIGKWHLGWDWYLTGDSLNINNLNSVPGVDYSRPVQNGPKELGFNYSYGFSGSLDMAPYVYVENGQPTTIPTATTVNVDDKGFWREGPTGADFIHAQVLPHLTQKAVQYIDNQARQNQPFFLYFALPAPHTPILPITEFMGKSNTNFYGDFVLQMDDVVGQILEALEKNGIRDNTLIIFTSDNGCSPKANFEELGLVGHDPSYLFRGHKADLFEGGHRVPFIVSWPNRIKKSSRSEAIICTTDFMATAADITGAILPEDAGEDSYSFLPVLLEPNSAKPPRQAVVHHSIDGRFAIRQGEWKLILWPGSGGWSFPSTTKELQGLPPVQLFNLRQDPTEENNLYNKHPEMVTSLKSLLKEYIENGRSTPGPALKNDGPERWKELEGVL